MSEEKRNDLIAFCVKATATLHEIEETHIDRADFTAMDDENLLQEANWLETVT
ncbi:hypothetical protein [Cytobacillus gottheilii]|uniref:Uncharacterized protein n=1 Tax=Cytobacillus gottheilii TaxID=859144 RepID=A0ABX8FJ08_9BACI|nr:hypothetical protein [Cytobacillus gottheilii]QVY63974.1 hypothetical protein J1899_22310 [Cytobacillus gottheilii]